MAELWDLAQYVESHPQDYPQRWRLVKKLYMAWEYRDALGHLQVLKKEWVRKQNVLRYLAATHYRLGEYDDAIRELRESIEIWPNEVCLREQLARVMEAAGRLQEAADIWEQIGREDPKHSSAPRNLKRLREAAADSSGSPTPPPESDLHLQPGVLCPNCGAQNGEEFERCWQCHAPLTVLRPAEPAKTESQLPRVVEESWVWTLVMGFVIVAFLSVDVYFTLRQWTTSGLAPGQPPTTQTAFEMLSRHLALLRTVSGALLLVTWPVAFRLGAALFQATEAPARVTIMTGLLLAAGTYAATWLPAHLAGFAPLAGAAAALAAVTILYRRGIARIVGMWAIQGLLVIAVEFVAIVAVEGPRPVTEFPEITRYLTTSHMTEASAVHPVRGTRLPGDLAIEWASTGSSWLDEKAGAVTLEITPQTGAPPLVVDFKQDDKWVFHRDITATPCRFSCSIKPGQRYHLVVRWRDVNSNLPPVPGAITIYSVLPPRVSAG